MLLALLLLAPRVISTEDDPVFVLSEENVSQVLDSYPAHSFCVLLHNQFCPHCIKFMPIFHETAKSLWGVNGVLFATIDCNANSKLCKKATSRAVPQILHIGINREDVRNINLIVNKEAVVETVKSISRRRLLQIDRKSDLERILSHNFSKQSVLLTCPLENSYFLTKYKAIMSSFVLERHNFYYLDENENNLCVYADFDHPTCYSGDYEAKDMYLWLRKLIQVPSLPSYVQSKAVEDFPTVIVVVSEGENLTDDELLPLFNVSLRHPLVYLQRDRLESLIAAKCDKNTKYLMFNTHTAQFKDLGANLLSQSAWQYVEQITPRQVKPPSPKKHTITVFSFIIVFTGLALGSILILLLRRLSRARKMKLL